tara:strand:+ start:585 stop:803 length:219 start_codon:yes stop_codon:yes gene_type:complete
MAFKMRGWSAFHKVDDDKTKTKPKKEESDDWTNPDHPDHEKMMKINIEEWDEKQQEYVDPKTGKPWVRGENK